MKRNDKSQEQFEKNLPGNPDWPPFPLPDIYDDDDPHLVSAAHAAIRRFRRNYVPEIGFNGEQLKAAVEVALTIQSAWSNEGLELREMPLAGNLDWPAERDFIELEQWFVDAHTAIAKEIASGAAAAEGTTKPGLLRVACAGGLSLLLIVAFEWLVYGMPFDWLRNHSNSYSLQASVDGLIVSLMLGLFLPRWRKVWWLTVLLALVVLLISLLGGPSKVNSATYHMP